MEEELGRKSYEEKQEVLLDSTNSPASSCDPNWERDILSTSSKNMMCLWYSEASRKCDAQLPTKESPTWQQ